MKSFLLSSGTLWLREVVRFYRQPSRIMGALATPLMFWLLIGSGIGTSFRSEASGGGSYLLYFFPGALLMTLLFTAIFSTISLIEDRREGFLQGVLIAPVPRSAFVMGKVLGGATLAFLQAAVFSLIAPLVGLHLGASALFLGVCVLFVNAFALTCLGFLIAWHFQSIQGFHAVMNLFLMPLWILSGSLFPEEGASGWLRPLMRLNPLRYGLESLQALAFGRPFSWGGFFMSSLFAASLFALAVFFASRSSVRDAR